MAFSEPRREDSPAYQVKPINHLASNVNMVYREFHWRLEIHVYRYYVSSARLSCWVELTTSYSLFRLIGHLPSVLPAQNVLL